ncbi:WXG100 family type VII secretion target [Mycobacterium sp. LTG2003]
MADELGVTPAELRATSQHLADVSGRMLAVLSGLRAKLSGEGAAWGDDRIGGQFVESYLPQLDWVDGSVVAKTDLLGHYSRGLKNAADAFEQQDQA